MNFVVIISAIISEMLINNVLLTKYFGMCSFVGVTTKVNKAFSMGVAVFVVMVLSVCITYPIFFGLLLPYEIGFIDTIVFILVISSLVQFLEILLKRFLPALYKDFGVYLPLITTNCCILGIVQLVSINGASFIDSLAMTIGSGLGYLLIMVVFTAIRERLAGAAVPKRFKGVAIAFITAGLMALAFMGFQGLI
jgi:electron transport complex protein RnfA